MGDLRAQPGEPRPGEAQPGEARPGEAQSSRPSTSSGHDTGADQVEIVVGVIGRPHGIRGEVVIEVRTDEPDRRFAAGQILRTEDTTRTFRVVSSRVHGGRRLVVFAELADRTAAELARGTQLLTDVDPAERPDDPEEYFDRQLVGLAVLSAAGDPIGRVGRVLHLPSQDVLEVNADGALHLIPFVSAIVPDVDLSLGTLRLADVPGLLGEEPDAD